MAQPISSIKPSQLTNPYSSKSTYQGPKIEYVKKPTTHNIFDIEPAHAHLSNPVDLVNGYLELGWTFIPLDPEKTFTFYQDILFHTQSIFIKPIPNRNDPSKIIYHSLYVQKFILVKDWGSHPSLLRDLPGHSKQFSYYDYKESWFKLVLY